MFDIFGEFDSAEEINEAAAPQLAEAPTALNSKRLPVKAKGEVRLRSVLSRMISGILPTFNFNSVFSSGLIFLLLTFCSISSRIESSCCPRNTDIITGGASSPPKRRSFPKETIQALNKASCSNTAFVVATKKTRNCILDFGFFPGDNKFTPVSVSKDQLLCLPEPLIPL